MLERRAYAAAGRFVMLLPPEGGVPGQCQIALQSKPVMSKPVIDFTRNNGDNA
jgi:hypothetical protein